ncbi:hypothetical protein [Cohaesibacter gelatinilyticus]|uniref:hypothetical protein n=1 Tax=Cohaesibacter gelatinilyticus TaxID=372072 RepID=UPI000BE381B8|nr:hypothetical protein [Cohaesibacter gelatinilyticus]
METIDNSRKIMASPTQQSEQTLPVNAKVCDFFKYYADVVRRRFQTGTLPPIYERQSAKHGRGENQPICLGTFSKNCTIFWIRKHVEQKLEHFMIARSPIAPKTGKNGPLLTDAHVF